MSRIFQSIFLLKVSFTKFIVVRFKLYIIHKEFSIKHPKFLLQVYICLILSKSTGSSIGQLLFNNNVKSDVSPTCPNLNCCICKNGLRPAEHFVVSTTNGRKYSIDPNINCDNCGIYAIKCPCSSLYTGKTTTSYINRIKEHFTAKSSSVYEHSSSCTLGKEKCSYSVQFLENVFSRGKYTLSEREYLWNERLRGLMNVQKTLKK